ncbi:hypothetical protein [Anaerospora sp.]|uniref:hypothetical protein n=1 Tax=Anaerospora sp. TaxID=1960278 RepID=UPI00289F200F|nr:hypothetical protein [Anaerospora sp.]
MRELLILTDNLGCFQISIEDLKHYKSMRVDKIKNWFISKGYVVNIKKFDELDFTQDYQGKFIIYQTSELPGSFYKHYIEDVVYFLHQNGAIVLPNFECLKAHHNKIYMEMMRFKFKDNLLKSIESTCIGSATEASKIKKLYPVVIKEASGCGSNGVYLARNQSEYEKFTKKSSKVILSRNVFDFFQEKIKHLFKYTIAFFDRKYLPTLTEPIHRPIVVQNFVNGLSGDYKVLVFGNKYYTLYRENRDNDFRASGSGKLFEVPEEEHEELLNFAKRLTLEIDFPIIGMDIGFDGKQYHLIEFQMIHLGPYTLQASKFWHEYHDGTWMRYNGESVLEDEYSRSIFEYIESHII